MTAVRADVRKLCADVGSQVRAASLLGVDARTVRRWCAAGECPALALRELVRIAAVAVAERKP